MGQRRLFLSDGARVDITDDGDATLVAVDGSGTTLRLAESECVDLAKRLVPPDWRVVPVAGVVPPNASKPPPNIVSRGEW